MDSFYIKGGAMLNGEVCVPTAKNALLPILACSIMCDGVVTIPNCTRFSDVEYMVKILNSLGAETKFEDDALIINSSVADKFFISDEYTKKVRSSIFMLGPLISKFKQAKVAYPGGCNIGSRPIDLHIKGLKCLNVKIEERHGYIYCDAKNISAGEVHLDFPSVGATENIMMASVFLSGVTTIYNAAKEPEIEDLQNFINAMGGKVWGAGTSTIKIEGVKKLHSVQYVPISDRIIAGTYLIACACTGGKIALNNTNSTFNTALISKLKQSGCNIKIKNDNIHIEVGRRPKSISKIETLPYPGFPTDLQSQMLTLQTVSKGTSVIIENLFETRFKIYTELKKMGADIILQDRMAIVKGVKNLYGASVTAPDLRSGAGLVIAGLMANGYTTINDVYHIDRGYFKLEQDLNNLGANIKRIWVRKKMKNARLLIILGLFVFITATIVLTSTVFTLNTVEIGWLSTTKVLNNTTDADIIESANFQKGESVFALNKEQYKKNLEKNNPYIKVINLEIKFPNKLKVSVVEREELYALVVANPKAVGGSSYVYLDYDLKVLKIVNSEVVANQQNPAILTINNLPYSINEFKVGEFTNLPIENILTSMGAMLSSTGYTNTLTKALIKSVNVNFDINCTVNIQTTYGLNLKLINAANKTSQKMLKALSVYEYFHNTHPEINSGDITVFEHNGSVEATGPIVE